MSTTLCGVALLPALIQCIPLAYQTDFTASCYSRSHGFAGAQNDYSEITLQNSLFDGLANVGAITISGDDYFYLEIDFPSPIELQSIQLIWTPVGARAHRTDTNSFTFTQITFHNLFTDTFDLVPHSQAIWHPVFASDYILFRSNITSNGIDLVVTDQVIVQLTFQNSSISTIQLLQSDVTGEHYTWSPTRSPTNSPTSEPTTFPSPSPTKTPTRPPTPSPTTSPSPAPTQSPTWRVHDHVTDRSDGNISYEKWSTNIYPLSFRNQTLLNFTVPDDKPYCLTCVLAWPELDATIHVEGCEDHLPSSTIPNAFYDCDDGVWILTTSGSLAQWQQTYGRIEIWELDANDIEYLQWRFEFQWNTSQCIWFNESTQSHEPCDLQLLPVTSSVTNTALFQWTMPKMFADNRVAPLVVVFYDLLSIPYAMRPSLDYSPSNLTLIDVGKGSEFGVHQIWTTFKPALIGAGILMAVFVVVSIIACLVAEKKQSRDELLLKTYNLRTGPPNLSIHQSIHPSTCVICG